MQEKYIVRLPIKDKDGLIIGYEVLYHGANQAFGASKENSSEFAAADAIYNYLMQNTDKLFRGSLNFMTFTTTLLMKKTPALFNKDELVIQIDDSVIIHALSMHMVERYAKQGYKIAVNEFKFAPRYLALMDKIDYIKVNLVSVGESSARNIVEIARSMNKKVIAVAIDTEELYNKAVAIGFDAMQGSFVAEKLATRAHTSGYLQSNFFRLLVAVTRDEPNVEEIEEMISMDASLSYGLLKMVNSMHFALRNRATTIRQAIVTLGLSQLKQWIYLLSVSNTQEEISPADEEFLKMSFMRASFCRELMNFAGSMPISKSEAYLMGMFSTLNYLIASPMEEILESVPISDEVRAAILHKEGRCGTLYDLVLCYERADWDGITRNAEQLGIPQNILPSLYFNCMESVNTTWSQLTQMHGDEPMEAPAAPADEE